LKPSRPNILPEAVALKQEAIPPPATLARNRFFLVNTLGESKFDLACSVERFQFLGGEFRIKTGEIVLELRYLPRSSDGHYWHRLMAQPGECDLHRALLPKLRSTSIKRYLSTQSG